MTDNSGAQRPTGKRQLSGAAETSSDAYQNKRVVRVEAGEGDSKPGGGAVALLLTAIDVFSAKKKGCPVLHTASSACIRPCERRIAGYGF